MTLNNPLDFVNILVVDLAGTPEVFSFLAIILISWALSRFNFSDRINLVFFALAGLVMATYLGGLYVVIILFIGLAVFYTLSKIVR